MTASMTGTVKWFDTKKNFGFITPDDSNRQDVFVHISALEQSGLSTLREGQRVQFELFEKNGKVSASKLKVVK